tara:strand:- start:2237 stop:3466 length:1230 start_codon:yes stop_codon:yes gene_type:complete
VAYAVGKFAKALCDRCGFEYKLHELREEWNNLKTCPSCFEPKAPQIDPRPVVVDPEALYKPRPNNDKEVGEGFVVVTYSDITKGNSMDPNIVGTNFQGVACVGSLGQVSTTQDIPSNVAVLDGLSATSNLGTVSVTGNITTDVTVTGLGSTASLGTVSVTTETVTTYTVTVVGGNPSNHPYHNFGSSNKYAIDGSTATADVTLYLTEGQTYRFDQSDSSNSGHPLRFSTTANGTHSGGSEYTTGVTTVGTPGSSGAYTEITVASGAPTLYYYCTNHSGMGWTAYTIDATYTISVVGGNPSNHPYYNVGSTNKFAINGSTATADVTLSLSEGGTYRFDQSDSSNSGHPLRFSTTANGTHASGSEYTTGVLTNGTPGSSGAYTQITVASGAPTLYYYCTNHSAMGWTANTP